MGIHKSQFPNSLVIWEKFGSTNYAYIQKFQFPSKLRSPAEETFKNSESSFCIEKNLEVQLKTNTLWMNWDESMDESMDELEEVMFKSKFHC